MKKALRISGIVLASLLGLVLLVLIALPFVLNSRVVTKLVDKYAAKLRSAQDEVQKRAGAVKPQGAFYARAASALRGNQMEQRMLTATQEIEKHTKKTAELLKGMDGGGSMTFQ